MLAAVAAILALSLLWPAAWKLFTFGPLHADDLALTLGASVMALLILEVLKPVLRPRLQYWNRQLRPLALDQTAQIHETLDRTPKKENPMAFKDILLTLTSYPDPTPISVTEEAVAIAASLGAHLAAVACEVHVKVPGHFLAGSVVNIPGLIAGEAEKSRKSARDMLAAFDVAATKAGIPHETYLEKSPTFAVPDLLVEYARLRDLTIIPVPESYDQWYAEALIFGSGRPTLVLPESPRPSPFELGTVAIAWDFSRAAARAVSDAMPLLERARKVRIVTVTNEKKMDSKHFAEELAKNLAHHGIDVVLDKVDASGRRIGEVLKSFCSFTSGRRSRDGRLRNRAMARVHPRRRHQEPAVKAAAPDHVLALTTRSSFSALRRLPTIARAPSGACSLRYRTTRASA